MRLPHGSISYASQTRAWLQSCPPPKRNSPNRHLRLTPPLRMSSSLPLSILWEGYLAAVGRAGEGGRGERMGIHPLSSRQAGTMLSIVMAASAEYTTLISGPTTPHAHAAGFPEKRERDDRPPPPSNFIPFAALRTTYRAADSVFCACLPAAAADPTLVFLLTPSPPLSTFWMTPFSLRFCPLTAEGHDARGGGGGHCIGFGILEEVEEESRGCTIPFSRSAF